MIQIVNSPSGTLQYVVPHVFSTVEDGSVVPGITTSINTGVLFTPIYTEKGPTGVVKYFSGPTAAADLLETFGNPNTRKLGLPYTAAVEHVQAGGHVAVISVKHESATNAGFIVNLVIDSKIDKGSGPEQVKKNLGWIESDGSGFVKDLSASDSPNAVKPSTNHQLHSINSKRIYFELAEVKDINSIDELEYKVQGLYDTEANKSVKGDKIVFPLIWGLYKGKGNYGNNYQMHFNTLNRTVQGRPYFEANIFDKRSAEYVRDGKQPVSLSTDRIDGVPLFIQRRYQTPYSSGDFYVNTLDNNELNHIGKLIQEEIKKITLFPNGADLGGAEAKALAAEVEDLKKSFDLPEDDDYHRLSNFDPTNLEVLNNVFNCTKLMTADFSGGSEGILEEVARKGFDWESVFNTAPTGRPKKEEKVLQQIFAKAFLGSYTSDVFNLLTNPCDYVIDMGYPAEVKKAMVNFAAQRDDVQIIYNAPVSINSISEALAWKQGFNQKGRNFYYYPGSFNYVDSRTDKSFRVPQSFAMMYNILDHYLRNGFDQPIAGLENGVITGVEAGSQRGFGDMSLKENERLYKAGFNIVSSHSEGLLYADSQKANYLLTEISALQEFHNNSIINRILKKLYLSLQFEKHRLNSPESVAKIVAKINYELQSEFSHKVRDLQYEGLFESSYAEAIGLMKHRLNIQFFVSIKYHHIHIKALPSA